MEGIHQKKEKGLTGHSQEKEKRRNKSQIECYRCINLDIIDLSVAPFEIERVVADLTLQK